jgi:RING finger protein 121/175
VCLVQAATMAYGRKLSVNPHICALCSKSLRDDSHLTGEQPVEPAIQLPCKHLFHELCIKGWTIVGKKDSCPTCMEKTDLKALYADRPWEARNLQWNGMLDFVRYMVVWNPIIFTALHLFLHVLHLDTREPVPESHDAPVAS